MTTEPLGKAVRQILYTLAIPAVLSACAHNNSRNGPDPVPAEQKVFRVVPAVKPVPDTPVSVLPVPAPPPTSAVDIPPASAAVSIIERLQTQKKVIAETDQAAAAEPFPKPPAKSRKRRAAKYAKAVNTPRKPPPPLDHWELMRNRMELACARHETIDAQIERLHKQTGSVDFLMNRAEPYLQYLLEEINRYGLPTDVMLVPMVESAFETTALSPKEAAGIWQFIPGTGQQYGLQLTETYDARYDMHAATQAALKYLKHLHAVFKGDWLLAFAAYNAGEGAVQRAIEVSRKQGASGSFWELKLPAETEAYVQKILALAQVIADPKRHGLKSRKPGTHTHLARVEVQPEVPLTDVMATSGISQEDFYKLNPAFKPDVPPPPEPHNLMLPLDKAENLVDHLAGTKVYVMRKVIVKKGETLTILAKRHGVPELKLAEWNGLTPRSRLKAGQELIVFPV